MRRDPPTSLVNPVGERRWRAVAPRTRTGCGGAVSRRQPQVVAVKVAAALPGAQNSAV